MKKIIHLFCASLFLLVGCTENVALEVNPVSEPFFASVEGTTRTYADENGKLLWTANDRITIFKGTTYPLVYQFTGSTGDNYGGFNDVTTSLGEFETSNALSANYAVYPYAANTSISNEGVINYTIPATQTYAENSFGLGANVMVAVTENKDDRNLKFKNVGGYFEFSLYGEGVTVESIVFSGNNNEKLAGDVSITATHDGSPVIAFADDATTTLTLDCGEGVELGADAEHATKFWFVVPSITYEDGITITITDNEGKTMQKSTSKEITIERSTVQPLAAFKVETYTPIPTNQIWYTSTYGKVVTPNRTNVFGANIVSNVYENGKGVITFDGPVTSIGNSAFNDCSSLESITIPDSVTSIGSYAFAGFSWSNALTSVIIPNSVTSIGEGVFYNCANLENVQLSESITSLGSFLFEHCYKLSNVTIPDSVTSISRFAFIRSGITSITIPNNVTSLGENPFAECPNLQYFYGKYASQDNKSVIKDNKLISFAPYGIEEYVVPNGVAEIAANSFAMSENLKNVKLPSSVTSIGYRAFSWCEALESITIPNGVTSIGDGAFTECSSLTSIIIPDGVTSIGSNAFIVCTSLESITLPDSVTSIEDNPFYGCSSLVAFSGKFASADNRCLIVDGELKSFAPAGLTSYTIPSGVTSIGDYAFSECKSLSSITIPDSVTSIGYSAFYSCSSLTSITIPNRVTSIGGDAFTDCSYLTAVYSKNTTPPSAGTGVFRYCHSQLKIYVPTSSVSAYQSADGWSEYASKIEGTTF